MSCLERCAAPFLGEFTRSEASARGRLAPLLLRLRWVVAAVTIVDLLLTLLGQPQSFWRDPTTAIRADGLSVFAATNRSFDFWLGHGALPFVATSLLGLATLFFAVARLQRTLAMTAIFAVIFAQGFDVTNWLVVRFHFGMGGAVAACGGVLGVLLSFAILPTAPQPRAVVAAWRWVMVAVLFVDFALTLLGQPASYWSDPATMHEGNALSRLALGHSWIYFLGLEVVLAAGQFALVTILPVPIAFVCVFAFIFGNFIGGSNWFFYVWRLGWIAPVSYGVLLSVLMTTLACCDRGERKAP